MRSYAYALLLKPSITYQIWAHKPDKRQLIAEFDDAITACAVYFDLCKLDPLKGIICQTNK